MSNTFEIEDDIIMKYLGDDEEIVIHDGVKDIFFEVFFGNTKIKSVVIPGSISSLIAFLFERCPALTSVELCEGVADIGLGAFMKCKSLTSVILPRSLIHIGKSAFEGCRSLKYIYYRGTKFEWDALKKDNNWDLLTGDYTVIYEYNK